MKTLKRIIYTNRGLIYLNLIMMGIMGTVGFFLHDIIMAFDKSDEEMTVFPMGTLCMFLSIIFFTCFFSHQNGLSVFNMTVSMGQTRKSYFIEQTILRVIIILADQLIMYGMYHLELLKFEKFYYPRYTLELDMSPMFTFKPVLMITLAIVCFCMIVLALSLKFGMKANALVAVVYFGMIMLMTRIDVIAPYFKGIQWDLGIYMRILYYVFTVAFIIGIVVSGFIIRRQQVTV